MALSTIVDAVDDLRNSPPQEILDLPFQQAVKGMVEWGAESEGNQASVDNYLSAVLFFAGHSQDVSTYQLMLDMLDVGERMSIDDLLARFATEDVQKKVYSYKRKRKASLVPDDVQ